jgi:hypothetical protein
MLQPILLHHHPEEFEAVIFANCILTGFEIMKNHFTWKNKCIYQMSQKQFPQL